MTRRVIQRTPNLGLTVRLQPLAATPTAAAPVPQEPPPTATPGAPYWLGFLNEAGNRMTHLNYTLVMGWEVSSPAGQLPQPSGWVGYIDGVDADTVIDWTASFVCYPKKWDQDGFGYSMERWINANGLGEDGFDTFEEFTLDVSAVFGLQLTGEDQPFKVGDASQREYYYEPVKEPAFATRIDPYGNYDPEQFVLPTVVPRGPMVQVFYHHRLNWTDGEGVYRRTYRPAPGTLTLTASYNGEVLGTLTFEFQYPIDFYSQPN